MTDLIGGTRTDDAVEDLEAIVPEPGGTVTVGGVVARVNRLKTREFLALLRVLTRSFGDGLAKIQLTLDDEEELKSEMLGMMVVAIPEAIDEFVAFVQVVCKPLDPKDTKALRDELDNPEIDEMMEIAEMVVIQEIDDLRALAGKAQSMWSRIQGVYQTRKT